MDFEEEKLPLFTILFITGICSLLFTGVIYLLDGHIHLIFLRAGLISLGFAVLLFLFKYLGVLSRSRGPAEKTS